MSAERTSNARATALPATGVWCAVAALVALAGTWHTTLAYAGRTNSTGFVAVGIAAPVFGGLALVLLAALWWRPRLVALGVVAAPIASIASIVCALGGDVGGRTQDGAGPWVSSFGFGTASLLAVLAAVRGRRAPAA